MNVSGVTETPLLPANLAAGSVGTGSIATSSSATKVQGLGAFLALLGELIEIPSSSSPEQPTQSSNRSNTNTANAKGKNLNGGGKNSGQSKKEESSPQLPSISPTPEPASVIVKPPIALATPSVETPTQSNEVFRSETEDEAEGRGDIEANPLAASDSSLSLSLRASPPAPSSSGQAPNAEIAFGLRLISANPQPKSDSPAPISCAQEPPVAGGKSSPQAIPIQVAATPEPDATPAEPASPDFERPAATFADVTARITASAAAASSSPPSLASALSEESDRSDVRGSQNSQLGTPTTEIVQASRTLPENSDRVPLANDNNPPSHVISSQPDMVNQTIEVDEPSAQWPVVRNAPDVRGTAPSNIAGGNLSSQNTPSGPSEPREVSYSRPQSVTREVSPQPTQGDRSQGESNSIQPTSKASAATVPKPTMPVATKIDGEAKSGSLESSVPVTTTTRTPDAETDPSPAGDSQPTSKVETGPEINAPSQPQPARQISLKLTGPDAARVDVELSEKGGKVEVAVRTADRELAKSLQGDLGDLVGRLETKGFKTETWVPGASHVSHATAAAEPSSAGQGDREHSGSGAGQQPGRQGRNGSNQRQQARWMAQLQESMSTEETGSENE